MPSLHCPLDLDVERLGTAVRDTYARVALDPDGDFHFNRGPAYAVAQLGYDAAELAALPARSTARFAGLANPFVGSAPRPGETVVDVGCGAGQDLLLAARRVGLAGRAIGVDGTDEMIACCRASAADLGFAQVEVRKGDLHALPVADGSVDLVISNGVVNLSHDKPRALAEMFRVLAPGGRLALADIVVSEELEEGIRRNYELWAA